MRLKGTAEAQRRAKTLRREMSLTEVLLWQQLRGNRLGPRFRHQIPAGPYDPDFYCATARLAIEVDGEAHNRGDRPRRDAVRDAWLAAQSIRVMRISARDVLGDLDAVIRGIRAELDRPPPPASLVPLPR